MNHARFETLPYSLIARIPEGKGLVIFDGYCVVCSKSVHFLLKIDRDEKLLFTAGNQLKMFDAGETGTIIYISNGSVYHHFDAVIALLTTIGGFWKFVAVAIGLFPRKIRNNIYKWIARNRFRWFGRRKSCLLPEPENKHRFL